MITKATLLQISGRQRKSAIRRWLDRERIPYLKDADGWPIVSEAVIMERFGEQPALKPEPELILD